MKKILLLLLLLPSLAFGQSGGFVISNFASSGSIGTAAATVDIYSRINIHQTTSSVTLSVPNPTNKTTKVTEVWIGNTGTASFTLTPGGVIDTACAVILKWTGSDWYVVGKKTNADALYIRQDGTSPATTGNIYSGDALGIRWGDGSYLKNFSGGALNLRSFSGLTLESVDPAGGTVNITGANSGTINLTADNITIGSGSGYLKTASGVLNYIPTIPNADLANSTISGVALGGTLATLSAGTGLLSSTYTGFSTATFDINTAKVPYFSGSLSGTPSSTTFLRGDGVWSPVTSGVSSVFGRIGAVTATSGDYTTAQVTESGNLYYTNARGIGSLLTSYSSTTGTISSSDNILQAIQKLNGNDGLNLKIANNLSDIISTSTARGNLGLGTLATQNGTFSGTSSGTNTGDQTTITGNAGTATALQTARTINGTSFDGTANITVTAVPSGSAGGDLTGTYPNPTLTIDRMRCLIPTAVKTTTYSASANDFIPCDNTSGTFTVTLPNAPADKTVIGIKMVIQGSTNTIGIACSGSDVFNKAGGSTTGTLSYLNQCYLLQYKASSGIWYLIADDLPKTALDAIYAPITVSTNTKKTLGTVVDVTPVAASSSLYTVTNPSSTVSFGSTGISLSGTNNTPPTNYLEYSGYYTNVALHEHKVQINPTSDGLGIGAGVHSGNGDQYGRISLSGGTKGFLTIETYRSSTVTVRATSATALTYTNSTDIIELTFISNYNNYTCIASVIDGSGNYTGTPVSVEWTDFLPDGGILSKWQVGRPTIFHFGGSQLIKRHQYIVNEYVQNKISVYVDSRGTGAASAGWNNTWFYQLSKQIPNGVSFLGGGGNLTSGFTNLAPEFFSLKPQIAIHCLGINDAINSVPLATTQANILYFIAQCQQRGITPVVCTVPYQISGGAQNSLLLTMNTWILTLPVKIIDLALATGDGSNHLAAAYASSDGLHENAAGHRVEFAYIWSALTSNSAGTNQSPGDINIVVPSGTGTATPVLRISTPTALASGTTIQTHATRIQVGANLATPTTASTAMMWIGDITASSINHAIANDAIGNTQFNGTTTAGLTVNGTFVAGVASQGLGVVTTTFPSVGTRLFAIRNGTVPSGTLVSLQGTIYSATSPTGISGIHLMSDAGNRHSFTDRVGLGTATPGAFVDIVQPALTSGFISTFNITPGNHTGATASTELINYKFNANTTTQYATGALTLHRNFFIAQPTLSFVGASTVTNASTFDIAGAPVAGTNATITTSWAARMNGKVAIGSNLYVGAITTAPTALIHLAAGTAAANTSCFKMTQGALLTSAEAGAWGYGLNGRLFFSPQTTWKTVLVADTAVQANGMIPIGNGSGLTMANVTGSNGVSVTNGTGTIALAATTSIPGSTTNDAATAGNIGQEINSAVSTYTNYTTTATYQNIASITLTAGDWDISAFGAFSSNAATITAAGNAIFLIGTATASATGAVEGQSISYIPQATLLGTSIESTSITPFRVSLSGTTTYYLNTQATFTLGNPQYVGSIRARRLR